MKSILTLALLFGTAACSVPTQLDVGYNGDEAYYVDALIAAENWNQTCGIELIVVHKGNGDINLESKKYFDGLHWGLTHMWDPTIGMNHATSIWFYENKYAEVILTHEFGHALGLGHNSNGVMRSHFNKDEIDPVTNSLTHGMITRADCAYVIGKIGKSK